MHLWTYEELLLQAEKTADAEVARRKLVEYATNNYTYSCSNNEHDYCDGDVNDDEKCDCKCHQKREKTRVQIRKGRWKGRKDKTLQDRLPVEARSRVKEAKARLTPAGETEVQE